MRTTGRGISLFAIVLAALCANVSYSQTITQEKARDVLAVAGKRLLYTVKTVNDSTRYPRSTAPDGTWTTTDKYGWTSGFFPRVPVAHVRAYGRQAVPVSGPFMDCRFARKSANTPAVMMSVS